jgi:nicotinate-nucleotide pyrophosphorylase (carboxylating)
MWSTITLQLIEAACEEDLGVDGDITTALMSGANPRVVGRLIARQPGVICGLSLAPSICQVFSRRLNQPLELRTEPGPSGADYADGMFVSAGACVATLRGPRSAVLAAERTLLNFLGRLSGVATLTRQFVEKARQANPQVRILDTRKTLPGWRQLDKYAVRTGGGHNHRFGLYDAILIKDNHLAGIPTSELAATLTRLLRRVPRGPSAHSVGSWQSGLPNFVEVEVDSLEQFAEVCKVGRVDVVLLDNFTIEDLRAAVAYRDAHGLRGRLELEASGSVRLDNVSEIAATGVDRISVGALTHSAAALDIALEL